jgi:hypothetical protein
MDGMKENRSIPSSTVIPVLTYPDVRAATDWTFSESIADKAPEGWGGTSVNLE